jgi:hypothetical protein
MAEELWVVRADEQARYAEDFRSGEYIAVGFSDFFPPLTCVFYALRDGQVRSLAARPRAQEAE